MKRIGCLLLWSALAAVGCLPAPWLRQEPKPPLVKMQEPPPPRPVTADGITEENAAERARELREEMERERAPKRGAPEPKNEH
jgi:hypothetical protein